MTKAEFKQPNLELLAVYKTWGRLLRQSVSGIAPEDRETWAREMSVFSIEKHRVYRAIWDARK